MNALDIVIIVIFALCILRGVFQGLLQGISSLVAILAGLILAKRYYLAAANILTWLHIPNPHAITGYLFVFLVFYIGVKVIFFILSRLSKAAGLSLIDRTLGGLLGFFKAALYGLIIITILQVALPRDSAVITHSKILPTYNKAIAAAGSIVPQGFLARLHKNGPGHR